MRQIFIQLDYVSKLILRLKNHSQADEFLCSRILFFLTYETNLDFLQLDQEHGLANALCQCISAHAHAATNSVAADMALSETLKLIFNLMYHYPPTRPSFTAYAADNFMLLQKKHALVQKPLDPPVAHIVNVLLSIFEPTSDHTDAPLRGPSEAEIDLLITILDRSLDQYPANELDTSIAPLLSLVRALHAMSSTDIKQVIRKRLLPDAAEREKPLGQSSTTFARLISLSTSGITPVLRTLVPQLMYEMSDSNPSTFVHNVGYGYASGFLMNNGIDSSDLMREAQGHRVGSSDNGRGNDFTRTNFVTGQYLENEPQEEGPPMTDEEKEREAEKLFVLFERLKRTGVIDVVNPVETAARDGRFEEVD